MDHDSLSGNWTPASEDLLVKSFPVHRACRDGDMETLSSLLETGNINMYEEDDFYGWTPIHWAAYFGKLACVRRLIHSLESLGVCGSDLVTTRFSQTPVHLCAYGGHPQCLYWLAQSKCNLDAQDYMGETPLHKAARTGSMECVSLLVSQGARLSIRTYSGKTASQVAAAASYMECANYLERAAQLQNCNESGYGNSNTPLSHPVHNGTNLLSNGRTSPEGQSCNQNTFISTNTYHSHPHVPVNGAVHGTADSIMAPNGFNLNNNSSQSDLCDMEMGDESPALNHFQGAPNGDILLNQGISHNVVPLAGKKRGREDLDQAPFKRARNEEALPEKSKLNGWLFNNGHVTSPNRVTQSPQHDWLNRNGHVTPSMQSDWSIDYGHMTPVSDSMVEHYSSISVQQGYDSMMLDAIIAESHGY